jgi:hypothetical protein
MTFGKSRSQFKYPVRTTGYRHAELTTFKESRLHDPCSDRATPPVRGLLLGVLVLVWTGTSAVHESHPGYNAIRQLAPYVHMRSLNQLHSWRDVKSHDLVLIPSSWAWFGHLRYIYTQRRIRKLESDSMGGEWSFA